MTNPLAKPEPYQVIFHNEQGERRVLTTHSLSQAEAWRRTFERAGWNPSVYIGEMEIHA